MNERHGHLTRLSSGQHGKRAAAVLGTTCNEVKAFFHRTNSWLSTQQVIYLDESHDAAITCSDALCTLQGEGMIIHVPDSRQYMQDAYLRQGNLTIVNGNHFPADEQIVIYHPDKEQSLQKRLSQLTKVLAFIGPKEIQERLIAEGLPLEECMQFDHLESIELKEWMQRTYRPPLLRALLLVGGKSVRMGQEKGLMIHHQLPQYQHLSALMGALELNPILSCREEQASQYEWPNSDRIIDRLMDIGPLAGLLSTWMRWPDMALLTVACDMPALTEKSIAQLVAARDPKAMATTILIAAGGMPEPMLTIWEPRAYPVLMHAISAGITCPRKILQHTNVHSVVAQHPEELKNINTPEELAGMRK
jgi:molybdopterin-guanine dinucleotide biosynthesis protein A